MSTIDKLIRRQIKLTILSVIAVVLITSTITYALYQTNHENTTDQVISIGNLGLTATGTPITLEGLYPMEEYDLTSSYPSYNFTLENKTNGINNDYTLMYELILRTDENTTLSQDDYQYIMYKIDGSEAKPLSDVWDNEINGFKILDGRLLSHKETTLSTALANKDIENHNIVFWLSTYAPNSVQGKVLTLKMSLEAYAGRFNYLKYSSGVFGNTNIARTDIGSITVLDKIDIPSNAIEIWDVSNKQNKSIMAWYTKSNRTKIKGTYDTTTIYYDNQSKCESAISSKENYKCEEIELYDLYIGEFGGVVAPPNSTNLFQGFINAEEMNVKELDTSIVTQMYRMFFDAVNLTSLDVSNIVTSNVTFMESMFAKSNPSPYTSKLKYIYGGENWDTSNVTSMKQLFCWCNHLKYLDVSNFDTSNVTNMVHMFAGTKMTTLDLSSWDTSSVKDMSYIFLDCNQLEYLNISSFDFLKVTSYTGMFAGINSNIKITVSECNEEFIRTRLAEVNRSNVTLEVLQCVKVCYVENRQVSTAQSLSNEYTELEYIESTGTQYIDTGYIPKTTTKLELDLSFSGNFKDTNTYGGNEAFLGVRDNDGKSNYAINFGGGSSAYNTLYPWFNKGYQVDGQGAESFSITNNIRTNRNTLTVENGRITYGTVSRAITPKSSDQTNSMLIFGYKNVTKGTINPFTAYNMKVYKMKMYENGTLVRNYVPALRKSDNTIGLYETEEGKFYENSGTGVFNGSMQTLTGNTLQLISTIDARPGYTFVGWNTKPDGSGTTFKQGEEVDASVLKSLGEDTITLYAMWEANE